MRNALMPLFSILLLLGCGSPEEGSPDQVLETLEPDTLVLVPADTIGVLMGDSNYVFGTIADAIILNSGDIVILDEAARSAMMYDRHGGFIRRIAREGAGPGEVLIPGGLVRFSDNTIGILDHAQGVHRYSPEGDFIELMTDFQGRNVPQWAWGVDEMGYVGAITTFEQTEEGIMAAFIVGRWDSLSRPTVEYFRNEFMYMPERPDQFLKNSFFSASFAASREGIVCVAQTSSEDYSIDLFDPDGTAAGTIERDLPGVEKSEAELADETAMINAILRERGVPEEMQMYRPDPCRWMIQPQGLSVDGQGRIWARSGTADGVVMDVYSREGGHLAVVRVLGVTDPDILDFLNVKAQRDRLLIYSLQAPDYPRLYIIDIPEFDQKGI